MRPERKENYSMVFDGTDLAYHYEDLTLTQFWCENVKNENWNDAVAEHIMPWELDKNGERTGRKVINEQFRIAKENYFGRGVSYLEA